MWGGGGGGGRRWGRRRGAGGGGEARHPLPTGGASSGADRRYPSAPAGPCCCISQAGSSPESMRNWGRGSRWPQLPPGSPCSFPLNRMGSRMFGGGGPAASSWSYRGRKGTPLPPQSGFLGSGALKHRQDEVAPNPRIAHDASETSAQFSVLTAWWELLPLCPLTSHSVCQPRALHGG